MNPTTISIEEKLQPSLIHEAQSIDGRKIYFSEDNDKTIRAYVESALGNWIQIKSYNMPKEMKEKRKWKDVQDFFRQVQFRIFDYSNGDLRLILKLGGLKGGMFSKSASLRELAKMKRELQLAQGMERLLLSVPKLPDFNCEKETKTGGVVGAIGGVAAGGIIGGLCLAEGATEGAAIGAAAGSFFSIPGMIIGGVLGLIVGTVTGLLASREITRYMRTRDQKELQELNEELKEIISLTSQFLSAIEALEKAKKRNIRETIRVEEQNMMEVGSKLINFLKKKSYLSRFDENRCQLGKKINTWESYCNKIYYNREERQKFIYNLKILLFIPIICYCKLTSSKRGVQKTDPRLLINLMQDLIDNRIEGADPGLLHYLYACLGYLLMGIRSNEPDAIINQAISVFQRIPPESDLYKRAQECIERMEDMRENEALEA